MQKLDFFFHPFWFGDFEAPHSVCLKISFFIAYPAESLRLRFRIASLYIAAFFPELQVAPLSSEDPLQFNTSASAENSGDRSVLELEFSPDERDRRPCLILGVARLYNSAHEKKSSAIRFFGAADIRSEPFSVNTKGVLVLFGGRASGNQDETLFARRGGNEFVAEPLDCSACRHVGAVLPAH